jgi:hypothetical protein
MIAAMIFGASSTSIVEALLQQICAGALLLFHPKCRFPGDGGEGHRCGLYIFVGGGRRPGLDCVFSYLSNVFDFLRLEKMSDLSTRHVYSIFYKKNPIVLILHHWGP